LASGGWQVPKVFKRRLVGRSEYWRQAAMPPRFFFAHAASQPQLMREPPSGLPHPLHRPMAIGVRLQDPYTIGLIYDTDI
jgi:hypothetical protein